MRDIAYYYVYICSLQSSAFLDETSVSYPYGTVSSVENVGCFGTLGCYGDGYTNDTVKQLQYVSSRYGPVSSWSSAYRTDVWSLDIERSG